MRETPSYTAVTMSKLTDASNWWNDVNESPLWQDRIFHGLAALYALVAAVALVIYAYMCIYVFVYVCVYRGFAIADFNRVLGFRFFIFLFD